MKTFNELIIDWGDDAEAVRQEAIKWVKASPSLIEDLPTNIREFLEGRGMNIFDYGVVNEWIKHFFNLKEVDLK